MSTDTGNTVVTASGILPLIMKYAGQQGAPTSSGGSVGGWFGNLFGQGKPQPQPIKGYGYAFPASWRGKLGGLTEEEVLGLTNPEQPSGMLTNRSIGNRYIYPANEGGGHRPISHDGSNALTYNDLISTEDGAGPYRGAYYARPVDSGTPVRVRYGYGTGTTYGRPTDFSAFSKLNPKGYTVSHNGKIYYSQEPSVADKELVEPWLSSHGYLYDESEDKLYGKAGPGGYRTVLSDDESEALQGEFDRYVSDLNRSRAVRGGRVVPVQRFPQTSVPADVWGKRVYANGTAPRMTADQADAAGVGRQAYRTGTGRYGRNWLYDRFVADREQHYLDSLASAAKSVVPDSPERANFLRALQTRDPEKINAASSLMNEAVDFPFNHRMSDEQRAALNGIDLHEPPFRKRHSWRSVEGVKETPAEYYNLQPDWKYYWNPPDEAFSPDTAVDAEHANTIPLPDTEYSERVAAGEKPLLYQSGSFTGVQVPYGRGYLDELTTPVDTSSLQSSGVLDGTNRKGFRLNATLDPNGTPDDNLYARYYGADAPEEVRRILSARGVADPRTGMTPNAVKIDVPPGHPYRGAGGPGFSSPRAAGITPDVVLPGTRPQAIPASGVVRSFEADGRPYARGEDIALPAGEYESPDGNSARHETAHVGNYAAQSGAAESGGVGYGELNDALTKAPYRGPGVFGDVGGNRVNLFNYHWDQPDEFAAAYANILRNEAKHGRRMSDPSDFGGFLRKHYGSLMGRTPAVMAGKVIPSSGAAGDSTFENGLSDSMSGQDLRDDPVLLSRAVDRISKRLGLPNDSASLVRDYLMLRELDPKSTVDFLRERAKEVGDPVRERNIDRYIKAFGTPEERRGTWERINRILDSRLLNQIGTSSQGDSYAKYASTCVPPITDDGILRILMRQDRQTLSPGQM